MKINLTHRQAESGNLRLSFIYHCRGRRSFPTGVTVPSKDFRIGSFDKPVLKTNQNFAHLNGKVSLLYHELQQIISTLRREDKIPTADLVFQIFNDKRKIDVKGKDKRTFTEIFDRFVDEKSFSAATKKLYQIYKINF